MLDKVSPQSMADEHLLPAALLEMGDSLNFIEVRKHTLRREIKDSKLSAAAGKFSGLGAIVGGVALAALSNPLGWLIGGCGLTAYTLSVFGQWLQTGKVHPMPLSSKSQAERDEDLAGQTVSGDGGNLTGRTAIHEEAAYLSDREKTEYELLHFAPQGLMSAMNNVPPAQRWACYQFLVDAFAAGTIGDYANPQTLKAVLGNPSVYSSHLPEASKRFPQYGLPAVETPQSQSESLPAAEIATSSPIGNTTRLGAVNVPSSPAAQSGQWDEDEELMTSTDLYEWMKDLLSYPSVLIYGAQGSGKSTFAEWLMTERAKNGHKLEILDPHREFGQWDGLEVFGDGMDYNAIDDRLEAFADLVVSRYLGRSKKADFNPCPLTVLAEEFTQWSKKCSHAAAFFETSLSDIRKINCHVVYVSHGRTLTCLGGAKGLADTRDATLLELELLTKVDETTGKAVPALRGLLKYPGRSPIEVAIPVMKAPSSRPKTAATPQDLERIYNQPSADHEVEEEEIEQQDTTAIDIKELFPHWNEKMISVAVKVLIHLRSKGTLKAYEIKSATAELRAADRTKTDKLLVELIAKNLVQVADGNYSAIAPSADSLDELDW